MSLIAVYERARNNNESTTQLICYIPQASSTASRHDGHPPSDACAQIPARISNMAVGLIPFSRKFNFICDASFYHISLRL